MLIISNFLNLGGSAVNAFKLTVGLIIFGLSQSVTAITIYNDRIAFTAALENFTVDSLNGITAGTHGYFRRNDYDYYGGSGFQWGCIDHAGCGDNSAAGWDDAYLWTYDNHPLTFTVLPPGINAFGFDYGDPVDTVTPSINGISASYPGGISPSFFGVIFDEPTMFYYVRHDRSYMLLDNITFGVSKIPTPSPLVLFAIGLAIVGFTRKHKDCCFNSLD